MNYEGIQCALKYFIEIQMYKAEIQSRQNDYIDSNRRSRTPTYQNQLSDSTTKYKDQPIQVERVSYEIYPNETIENLFGEKSWKAGQ
jgi:hypothetical protein